MYQAVVHALGTAVQTDALVTSGKSSVPTMLFPSAGERFRYAVEIT
jgi:hypothetical protein